MRSPPKIPSSLRSHTAPVSFLFLLLFPISRAQLPLLERMQSLNYSEALRMSRIEAAAPQEPWGSGQKDLPGGELGRLDLRGPWAWLRAPPQKGQQGQDYRPARQGSWG